MIFTRTSGLGHTCLFVAALLPVSLMGAEPEAAPTPTVVSLGEALEATLARQPGVQITREQVAQREGNLQSASGQFDWALGSFLSTELERTPTGSPAPFPGVRRQESSVYSLGLTKQFRSGVVVTPQVTVVDAKDSITSPAPVSQSRLELVITVPLLRGLGARNTGAQEIAAGLAAEAQQAFSRYQLELIVFQTAAAYWNCLAARRDFEILSDAASRAEQILKSVETLASGGELDRATRDQARALVASKQAERENGELTYYKARQALGLAIGFTPKQITQPPEVVGTPPSIINLEAIRPAVGEKYVSEALTRRGDYQAANLSVETEEALLRQARNNLKPQLDLGVTVGYAGYDRRGADLRPAYALSNDLTGVNALGTLNLAWPLANNVARGGVVTQRARRNEARLNAEQAGNTVASRVLVALQTLRQSVAQYGYNATAVDTYRTALAQTNEKLKAGEASITELIDVEERYAEALRAQNETTRSYAVTLAELRLVTGTLSEVVERRAVFNVHTLTEVPFTP